MTVDTETIRTPAAPPAGRARSRASPSPPRCGGRATPSPPPGARRSPTPSSAARSARSPAGSPSWGSSAAITSRSSPATRPEWTLADFGALSAGATVVPVYQTNSPEECEYILAHAGVRAIFCEDAAQVAKIEQVRERCPSSST